MALSFTLLAAVALDALLGEPRNSWHPLVWFGRWVRWLERGCYRPQANARRQRLAGGLALLVALLPASLGWAVSALPPLGQAMASIALVYLCIAPRSLQQHAMAVFRALRQNDLALARQRVGYIVSRQTEGMAADDVRRAAVESVLENGADAVFAPLFWYLVLGPFGILLYRCANTLDAMWGYKNDRYRYFGWAAARFDDGMNWLPARLTALSYALLGHSRQALSAWRRDAPLLDSPNAGPVMAAGAGALDLKLGGPARYHGQIKLKPWFGGEQTPTDHDIPRATGLIYRCLGLWLLAIFAGDYIA